MPTLTNLLERIETAKRESAGLEVEDIRKAIDGLEAVFREYDPKKLQEMTDEQYKQQRSWREIILDVGKLTKEYPEILFNLGRLYYELTEKYRENGEFLPDDIKSEVIKQRKKAKTLLEKDLRYHPIPERELEILELFAGIYAPFGLYEEKPGHPFSSEGLLNITEALKLPGRRDLIGADLVTKLNHSTCPEKIHKVFVDYADELYISKDMFSLLNKLEEASEVGRSLSHAAIWAREDKKTLCKYLEIFGQFYVLKHFFQNYFYDDFRERLDHSLAFFKELEGYVEETPWAVTLSLDKNTYIKFEKEEVSIDCVNDVFKFRVERSKEFIKNATNLPFPHINPPEVIKIYKKEDTSQSDLDSALYFSGAGIRTALPLNDAPILLHNGKEPLFMNRFELIEGECFYSKLNEELRGKPLQKKEEIFMDSIVLLANVHYFGLEIKCLEDSARKDTSYFTNRISEVLVGKFKDMLGLDEEDKLFDRLDILFRTAYKDINDLLVKLSLDETAYYRDGSPRNQMVTQDNDIVLVDFESNRKLWKGFDLISLLECGLDYAEDGIVLDEEDKRRDYLNETQKRNLVDRYLLVVELLEAEKSGNKLDKDQDRKKKEIEQLLDDKSIDIDAPDSYANHELFRCYIRREKRDEFQNLVWSVAKMHRHLEYIGYSARDIRKAIDNNYQERVDVNRRCLMFHYLTAYKGYQKLTEIKPDIQGLDKLHEAFNKLRDLCKNDALKERIEKVKSQAPFLLQGYQR